MALDILAAEYEAEDSQTMTTVFDQDKEEGSDSETNEDTIIEYDHDSHPSRIDRVIQANAELSSIDPLVSPPHTNPYAQPSASHNMVYPYPRGMSQLRNQPSTDFLLMVENLQIQLHQKDASIKHFEQQWKTKSNDYDNISRTNNELKQQIQRLREKESDKAEQSKLIQMSQELIEKNEHIDVLNKQMSEHDNRIKLLEKEIEGYREVEQWLAMQIKWETDADSSSRQSTMPKLCIKTLEEWKHSSISFENNDDYEQKQQEDTQDTDEDTEPLLDTPAKNKKKRERFDRKAEQQIANANVTCSSRCFQLFRG